MRTTDWTRLVEQTRDMAAQVRGASDKVDDELSDVRFVGTSDGDLVTAEVDYRAGLVDVRIARVGMTRTRRGELARHVVDAVTKARRQARDEYLRSFRAHAGQEVAP